MNKVRASGTALSSRSTISASKLIIWAWDCDTQIRGTAGGTGDETRASGMARASISDKLRHIILWLPNPNYVQNARPMGQVGLEAFGERVYVFDFWGLRRLPAPQTPKLKNLNPLPKRNQPNLPQQTRFIF